MTAAQPGSPVAAVEAVEAVLEAHAHSANGPRIDPRWYVICRCGWRDEWAAGQDVHQERERAAAKLRRHVAEALAAANLLAAPVVTDAAADGLREAVKRVVVKWSCPPLENRGNTLVLRDLRDALAAHPAEAAAAPESGEADRG